MEETTGRIVIDTDDRAHLRTAGKWAQFLAIVQFIFIGFGVIGALIMLLAGGFMSAAMSQVPGLPAGFFTWYALFIIVMLVIAFFLALYLSRFASKALRAAEEGSDTAMTEALANLGRYFRLQGILLIVSFAIGILMMVVLSIFAGAMAAAGGF